jgi:hypothetical protein
MFVALIDAVVRFVAFHSEGIGVDFCLSFFFSFLDVSGWSYLPATLTLGSHDFAIVVADVVAVRCCCCLLTWTRNFTYGLVGRENVD